MTLYLKKPRISVELSEDLRRQYGAAVKLNGEHMCDPLLRFIKAYLGKNRDQLDRLIENYRDKGAVEK